MVVAALADSGHVLAQSGPDRAAEASIASGPKTPAIKTVTNFSQALRCMDELFMAYGKQGIVVTATGISDETQKVKTGTKEMMISAIAKMTNKSNAFEFIDFHSGSDDLAQLFAAKGDAQRKVPDYYIRGSITQMDDNAVRKNKGFGFSLPFLDFGFSKDESFDLISMDMSVVDASSRKIYGETNTSNSMVIIKGGKSGEAGGKIGKVGLSFNMDLSQSEGLGSTVRTLIELGLIETLGKFTRVPYWRCLDVDLTNPLIREQAHETFDAMPMRDRILFVQRKLGGGMNRYRGPMDGMMNPALKQAIAEYQAAAHLIADGAINFDLYASLVDDTQNMLAALPSSVPSSVQRTGAAATAVSTPAYQSAPQEASGGKFRVNLQSDRGGKPSYRIGEFLTATLSLSNSGTAYCYYEDTGKRVARIFPNQFQANSNLKANSTVTLAGTGFKIRFDTPGKERIACIGADGELAVPQALKGAKDLTPLQVRSVDDVVAMFKQNNPAAVANILEISVAR